MSSSKKLFFPLLTTFVVVGLTAVTAAVLLAAGTVPATIAGAAPADAPSDTLGVGLRVASLDGADAPVTVTFADAGEPLPSTMTEPKKRAQAPLPEPEPEPAPTPAPEPQPAAQPAPEPASAAPAPSRAGDEGSWDSAVASWYGPGFYGRTTASGAVLTEDMMNVAHRTLPFGTKIQFQYNGRTATAVVNDRGPHISGRTFDLGPGTAKALGFSGVASVNYRILGR